MSLKSRKNPSPKKYSKESNSMKIEAQKDANFTVFLSE